MDRTEDENNTDEENIVPDIADAIRFNNRAISMQRRPPSSTTRRMLQPMFKEGDTAVRYVEEDSEGDRPVRAAETIGAPLAIDGR